MKNKIIAIVVTVVFIAGAGTAIGVTVDRQHNEETASLVNEAVSKALETTTTTTTATSTTTTAATTTTTAPAATKKTTTTTEAQTIMNTEKNMENQKIVTTSNEAQTIIIDSNNEKNKELEALQSPVHTPLGDVYKLDSNKEKDKIGYYWQTTYTFVPDKDDNLTASFYVYCLDENDKLFYFDDAGNRIYYKN